MAAISKQSLGALKESLAIMKVYTNKNPICIRFIKLLRYNIELKRYGESVISCDQIIANPESEKLEASISMKGGSQKVPLRAAAHNVKGIIAMDLNQPDIAKQQFETAIKLFPDFVLAQGNLVAIEPKSKSGNASSSN